MDDFLIPQAQINLFLQLFPQWFFLLMQFITSLGNELFYLLMMPLLYWSVNSVVGIRVGTMLLLSNSITFGVKMIFQSPRPYWIEANIRDYVQESTFGIPSGHAANAASVWGIFAASVRKRWFTLLVILLIFLIGFSRMVLGVHFLVDVLAGWVLGICILLLFIRLEKPVSIWFNRLIFRHQVFIAVFSSALLILPVMTLNWFSNGWTLPSVWQINAGHPIDPLSLENIFSVGGTWGGFLSGYAWFTHRYGRYSASGKPIERVLHYLVGIVGVVILWAGLDQVFPTSTDTLGLSLRYLRYFAIGFWITGVAPLLFSKLLITNRAN